MLCMSTLSLNSSIKYELKWCSSPLSVEKLYKSSIWLLYWWIIDNAWTMLYNRQCCNLHVKSEALTYRTIYLQDGGTWWPLLPEKKKKITSYTLDIARTHHALHFDFDRYLSFLMGKNYHFDPSVYSFCPFYTILDGNLFQNDGQLQNPS